MKTPLPFAGRVALLALFATLNSHFSTTYAQGTAFTYQGRLGIGTNLANGIYDLRFSLYDAGIRGSLIGGPLTNSATAISNGLFNVVLDFGAGTFTGSACWLELGVRTNGTAAFTALSPRQQLTATPYAILASGVGPGDITASMLSSGAVTSDKIAPGAIKSSQIDDGGSAAYAGFQNAAQTVTSNTPLPFAGLYLVAPAGGIAPALSLTINGASLGTVVGFSGSEGMSRPYCYVVEVQSSGSAINTDAELGLTANLTFTRNSRTTTFSGIVTACTLSGAGSTGLLYTVRIEPPLACLGFTTDYRIYQNMAVPDVASAVYQSGATNTPVLNLYGTFPRREYTCQYAETDLNFFNRILEYNGIFYFFDQSASPPTLTLGNAPTSCLSAPNSPFVYYGDTAANLPAGTDYIRTFQKASHQSVLKATVDAYNFQTPGADLAGSRPNSAGVGEHYEFSAVGTTRSDNAVIAAVRVERQSVERTAIAGSGTAPDLRPGYTFTLTDQTGAGLGGTYLVTDVQHAAFVRVTNGVSTLFYGNQFQVIPASLPYRPALQTPRPQALPCTAVVTGQSGEEISPDKYGRVKVQFHWDRYGTNDLNSSAWLRVTSPMASDNGRGMLFLPRIGDEVLVSFVQGDPDQPIVTGSLYNADNMPPYSLPGSKTISTIRSTGSKAHPGQVNEIMFDDLADSQVFNLRAAKDLNIIAANDLTITAAGALTVRSTNQTTVNGPMAATSLSLQTCSVSNLTLLGNLYLPNTAAGVGGIYFGGAPVLESFSGNFFAGANAGNVSMSGNYNTAVGVLALDAATTGANNTACGYGALGIANSGSENTALGVNALNLDLNGNQNVALGAAALMRNSSGSANTASGYEALFLNTSGSNNTANGYKALYSATGSNNVALGYQALYNAGGNNNLALGYQAGYNAAIGNNNIHIGSAGAYADNGIIRLGTPGVHSTTYLAGTVNGNGAGLTNLSASQLTGGTVADARLSSNVALLNASQTFAGPNTFSGSLTLSNLVLAYANFFMNDKDILLRNDLNHGIGWYGVGKLFAGTSLDGPVVYGYSGGGLGTLRSGTATNLALYWNTSGQVGIGTNSPNQKLVVAGNIYATGTITPNSDRNQKTDFAPVSPAEVLARVAELPIQQWRFKAEDASVKHVGPMAQDFRAAFGLGEIPTAIATVDADGVALAAIQGLNQKLEETRAENAALKARLEKLERLLSAKNVEERRRQAD